MAQNYYFTKNQISKANNTDLVSFLQTRGETLERVGREHKFIYHDGSGKHDSVTIRGATWFDHKNQVGGGAIKFMQYFYNLDFKSAVIELSGEQSVSHEIISNQQEKNPKREFKLPDANKDMHRVFAYLIKQRFVDADIISHFAHEKTLYEEKEHHNVVFIGTDENGIPQQAHKRSTNSFGKSFRITCEGSNTRYSFSHKGKSDKLFVFEAPIDMLSFITLNKENWQENSYIALNGVYENAMLQFLMDNKNLQEVILCLDNDEGGIEATERLEDILAEHGYLNVSSCFSKNKDWNEDLKEKNGQEALPAVPHKRKTEYLNQTAQLRRFSCKPDKLSSQLYATFKNGQYKYLAEYALAGSVFFIDKNNERNVFNKMKSNLICQYKAYSDKGKIAAKQDNLKNAVYEVMRDLTSNSARTAQQMKETSDKLFSLADCAVRCDVEENLSEPSPTQQQAPQVEESVGLCMG